MLKNIPKEKILEVIKQGPTIPSKIVKIVGGDTMLIGAILSTMISTGEIRYSSLKIGGSPLYYVPEHQERLEEFMNYLNEKDKKTALLLKEKKVLKDSDQDPLTRVSLRTIKDFAKPFLIDEVLFYRYFLVSEEDAEIIAREIQNKVKELQKELNVEEKTPQSILQEEKQTDTQIIKDITDKKSSVDKLVNEEQKEIKKSISEEEKNSEEKSKLKKEKEDFLSIVTKEIHAKGLDIISKEKVKKTEYVFVLKNHDSNEYFYCVAKRKKTINEGDLSTALIYSQQKNMPCIFIADGNLTKKTESMLQKEFKNLTLIRLKRD
ncbi:MAG: hypothetical protein KatS3mg002_0617 [Candidatus Woesearchaeota archaeon]|nr:MAG: hypothetical protein KatS3mg002_0617 [Candidatus Woesearchaeota archaeon]